MLQNCGFAVAELFYPLLGKRIPQMSKNQLQELDVPEKDRELLTPTVRHSHSHIHLAETLSSNQDVNVWFASEYLQCLKNPKLNLVQEEVVSLGKDVAATDSGKHIPCDVLILAHGFESETFNYPLKGRDGITPNEHWKVAGGPGCYKGCAMNGFPNFFMIRGPTWLLDKCIFRYFGGSSDLMDQKTQFSHLLH